MATTLDITQWEPGRLAISGRLENSRALFAALRDCKVKPEFWKGDAFTFSFPQNQRRAVERIVGQHQ